MVATAMVRVQHSALEPKWRPALEKHAFTVTSVLSTHTLRTVAMMRFILQHGSCISHTDWGEQVSTDTVTNEIVLGRLAAS